MAKVSFYGAAGTVTGSRYVLEVQDKKYLIDCGLFQGTKENRLRNWEPFPVAPQEIDKVFLTHAHIDHTGYLPRFCKDGFRGNIHSTYATAELCDILLKDSAHLQEEDAEWANKKGFSKHTPALPLYTIEDAEKALKRFDPLYYGQDFFMENNVRVKFKDAGHILGSSFIEFKTRSRDNTRKILFSGDFGRAGHRILREPVQVFDVDYLILESTYGNRRHDDLDPTEELTRIILESRDRGGVLVIPSFAIGRTQQLLYTIRELEAEKKIPVLDVYIDSPMGITATEVFRKYIADYSLTSRMEFLENKRLFLTKKVRFCRTVPESKEINAIKKNAVIISSSGMATGGRILHHLVHRLPESQNTILMIGFQAQGTRGRTILDGAPSVKIHGFEVPIKARVESISGFSGHGDYHEILAWLMGFNQPPEKIFLVHGEPEASLAMAEKIRKQFNWNVVIPNLGDSFDLNL